jgi:methylmalonyl-CoA decarboxylase
VIEATTRDGVTVLQMCDPARRNALGPAMLQALIAAFDGLPESTRAVVLRTGPDDRVWCAGFDIRELAPGRDPLDPAGLLHQAFDRVADCPAPVIAMIHGGAYGGGADLALRCDFAIGDPTAAFAFTPARLGLPYDASGLRNVMLRAGHAVAMEMFATGAPIAAERALAVGLLNHLVPEAELKAFTWAMAGQIAANAPLSITAAKRQLHALAAGMALPDEAAARQTALDSMDYREGLAAFAARRTPRFGGR